MPGGSCSDFRILVPEEWSAHFFILSVASHRIGPTSFFKFEEKSACLRMKVSDFTRSSSRCRSHGVVVEMPLFHEFVFVFVE